jgi:transcriptional regulator with XRE-family HTH domain
MRENAKELDRVKTLVHAASARIGSQNRLARALGYTSGNLTEWTKGKRPCPVKAQALMAHMTGLNATEVALWALIESETNPTRQEQLYEALGKGLARAGAVASLAMFSSAASASEVMRYFIRCILC